MKDKAIGYAIFIALGFVAIIIFQADIWPLITGSINDAVTSRPVIPTP